jgi:hypothetical protein
MFRGVGAARDDGVRRDGRLLRATSAVTAGAVAGAAGELDGKIRGGLLEAGVYVTGLRTGLHLTSQQIGTSFVARLSEQLVRFGSPLDRPWFDAIGPVADLVLR